MRLPVNKKTIFLFFGLAVVLATIFIAVKYNRPKPMQAQNTVLPTQPPGTCAPNAACKGNPELCMTDNLNKVCD
jgi:hypothetical protein